jgi:NADP-dependent 3-hydroxy acid dehydrogenase YdfG
MAKVAIIVGASSGIGQGLAIRYANAGYTIGLIARREANLVALQQQLPTESLIGVCDVTNKVAIADCIKGMIRSFGRIDIMIANAGISEASPATDANPDILESTIAVNVLGAGYCAYAAIPTMIKQGSGHIVVISSLAGYRGLPGAGAYCASKAAVNALFESMRLDLKPHNIAVSIIRPGFIKTAITNRNDYPMPFLQSLDKGCDTIFKALSKKKAIFSFPWPLAIVVRTLYFWPCWLYDLCLSGVKNKKRRSEIGKTNE